MFGSILISVCTLMHIYVFWRAASMPFVNRHVPIHLLIVTGLLFWAIFFIGRLFHHSGTGTLTATIELFGMLWMGALFLLFIPLLTMDIITGFGLLLPRLAPSLRAWALFIGGVLSVIALVQGLRPPVVQSYEVHLQGLSSEMDGKVLVAMSDLHIGSLIGKQWLAARVAQVRAEQPDLVILLGDLFEGHGQPQEELVPILRRLTAPLGIWAVTGNHEFHGRDNKSIHLIDAAGFRLLRNRWVEVRPGFILAGVDDLTSKYRAGQGGDFISSALADRPPGVTVLLSHTPWQADRAADAGASLMLSGHTHGGQIWPFGYLVRRVYPLLGGRYEVGGMSVIVCRGTGTWGPRMRLWRPGEILRVTLRSHRPPA
ncbi:MAG: metallophosphoesterase [Desulfobacterales bacterium]|jgi:predicted MPP superfamily phosphohydrolase